MTKSLRPFAATLAVILFVANAAFANTYTVTNTLDDNNLGSLRYAMNQANANAGADVINFNIPDGAPWSIALSLGALPALTGPTVIDGTTQPGFVSGTQSTYVKVGTAFTGTIFNASGVTGITIKGLDLSYSSPRGGAGIGFTNCFQTFILDNYIRNRRTGIAINGGQDHTVQNNDLLASGENTNEACIHLANITPGSIPGGIAMSGNKFGGNAIMGFRFDNMNNLVIGDASVSGAHIVIEDNSGFTAMGINGHYMLWFNNCNNITIDNVDLSWLGGGVSNSHGVIFTNAVTNSTFTVKNCAIRNRYSGISIGNGKDVTIQNNDLRGSGHENSYAVNLSNITEANVNGGILMSGNLWGRNTGVAESNGGLRLSNTNNLIIGDENTGVHIKIEDNSGFNTIAGNTSERNAMYLENVSNITVDNVDASWSLGGVVNSMGIRVQNTGSNGNITIKNCKVQNRYYGMYCNDGKDYTITGNDFRGSGHENLYALYLLNIAEGMIPGGVSVSGNLWGRNTGVAESNGGIYIADMSNLIIGDATTGVHIKIEDNSGFNTIAGNEGSYRGALLLERVSNIMVDNVDASWSLGGITNSFGIFVQNETTQYSGQTTSHRNVTIKDCDFRNRGMGIRIRGGKDYTVTGNDLRGCGEHGHHALQLINIQAGTLTGGILAHTNKFGTGAATINGGIYIQQMNDLTIGDATTGVNIKIEDNSGLNQIVGNDVNSRGALYLNTVSNVTVNSVDCSYATGGQAGNSFGIRVLNTASNSNISILNCNAGNRGRGIWVDNGRDYTITGNNMVGSGNGNPAFELSNIIPGSLTGGILASGNTFGTPGFNRGVAISNMRDLLIGDASVSGANLVLEDNCGLNQCVGADYNSQGALYLTNVNNVTVDNVDCSKSTTGASNSYGIVVANGANNQGITIKNCKADNRYRGIYCAGGKDYTVQNNTITNSGWDGTACALDFRDITAGTLPGGVLVSGNTFGNVPITANTSRAGVRFDNMRDLYISDGSINSNVKLEDGNGLTEVGFDLNSQYVVLNLNNISNSTIDNLNLSYTGTNQNGNAIRVSNGASQGTVTIKDCTINKRRLGIYVGGGRDYTITGNNLTGTGLNNSADINNGGPAVWLNGLVKGTLDGGIAMSGNTFGGANANGALRIDDMRGFTIGDAVSDDIRFEDGTSGLTDVGNNGSSNDFVLFLRQIADVTVNSVDLTRSGGSQFGGGIRVENGNGNKTVSLTNNGVGNRRTGLYISGGSDYTVTGNTLTGSGLNETEPALYLNAITAGTLPGGLSVSGNTFGGTNANTAVRFENLKDIVIGDASVVGRNVTLEDGTSGLSTVGNNATSLESVLYFSNLTNSSINNVDLTRTGGTQFGRGIYVANGLTSYPFSITNCAVGNRRTGIYINGGRNYTVQNNTLTGSGNNFSEPALYLNALTVNSNLVVNGNTFGGTNFNTGIRVENISDLLISDGTVSGTHIGVTTANGLGNATGYALYLANLTRTKVQNMDLSFTTTTRTGTGIQVTTNSGTTAQVEMKSLIVKNRVDGINITSGANHSVKCSDLSNNSDGLEIASSVTSFICEQNSFVGNVGFAINSAATITAENNYFGGGAPGGGANGVTGSVDATPFLTSAPANCPSTMAAHLELKGNLNLILNGSTTPSTINYTDLGSVKTGTPITRTYTINNTGGAALNITSISFTGGNAGDFSASALTPVSPVPAGGSATFTITFTPGAAGLRSTTLSIVNDDPNNNPFTAALQGTGKNVLVVTKTADTNDGVCDADCSLREAITVANSNADADVIEFNIGGGGAQTITHTTAFPNITQPLTIDGSSQPGFAGTPLITVNSNSSLTTFTATSVTGLTFKYLDLSRPIANYDGNGIIVSSCNEVFILNNIIKNRFIGIQSNGGRDHTIQNNDLRQTGVDVNNPAIYLNGLTARDVPGGIKMSGNLFGDAASGNRSRFGIRINTMSNLLIGDASVANANITIEDGSGMASTGTGDNYCLLLNNVSNTTVDNLDLTATTYGYQGWGVVVSNTADYGNVTVKNCKINNRYAGVYCAGGRDYTIQNNDLQKTGNDVSRPSLWFQNITPGTLPTGILASGNLFGDAGGLTRTALRVDGATGLLIGNQTVVGAHITIEDNSGIKAAASGDNYAVYLANVSNTTVDKLDLSSTIGYQGWGLVVQNSTSNRNVTIQNCKMNNRYSGIYCIGGKDYTLLNNDLKNTGNDNTRPALYLTGIRPGTLPAGVVASGNLFGTGTSRTALRVNDMDGLLIGDAGVVGAHIVMEDASGANTMSTDGDNAVIYLSAVSNLTVNDVDISRSASGRTGVGIWVENSGSTVYRNLSILNCKMQQRDMGLYINGGKDVTVTNNDMRYSGFYQDRPALWLGNIQSISLPGGVSLSGNKFGGTFNSATSNSGIQFANMRDLVMADAAAPGVNIVLEDNSGLNDVYGDEVSTRGAMYLNNVRNVQMTSIDLSKTTAGQGASYALKVNAGVNVNVLNGKGSNRNHGYYFEGGRDFVVTGNDLTGSGFVRDYPALRFSNVQPGSINTANGITASGNLFGGANVRTGLRIDNAKNLLIGDATVGGAHIVIEDASGLNNITQGDGNSEHPAIFLSTVSDITVDNVDASRPSGQDAGGIWVSNSITNTNITIKNCNFNRHRRAIYCTGGRDYTIQNNSLLNCGSTNDQPAIYLQNIQQGSLTGGILMSGNTFGGTSSFAGIRFENMRDLTIGDAATGGNVKIEDNSGLNNMSGNGGGTSSNYVLYFNNVNNATVDNVDLARPVGATPAQDLTGIRIDNGASYGPITIKDCNISRHRVGISAQGGKDYTVTGNDLRGCGGSSDDPALWFNGITQQNSTVPMGIIANTNTFGTVNSVVSNCALRLDNLCGIRISDGTVANTNISLPAASGIKEVTGTGGTYPSVITLLNTSGMAVEKLDLEFTGTQTGTAFRFQNANASQYGFSIKDNILKNRRMGVYILNGADYTITGNNFSMTGAADDEPAIRMEHVAEGTLYGGVSMSGNTFGGTGAAFGLKFVNMSNLKISDGSLSGTNVNLGAPSANGLYTVTTGNVLHLSGICNATVGMLDLSRAGLTRQGVGLRMNNGMGNTIQKVLVGNRDKGIEIAGGSNSQSFTCNTLFDNNFGIDVVLGTLLSTTLTNNILDCNGVGLRSTSTSTVAASNNYWGTANGSTTSGGSGDSYSGTVTATPFLAAAPACAQTPPDLETKANNVEIVDGDITPSFSDYTQYCAVTGQTQSRTYTLKNTGNGIMNLVGATPVTLSPASGTPFTITNQPADVELLPGETTTFSIQFAPVALGTSNVTLNIASKDCRENPYNFALKGQGCVDIQGTISGTQAICAGLSANLTVNISAGLAPFVVTLSDGSTFTVNNIGDNTVTVNPTATTTYTITMITDANGCCSTNTGSAIVTVNPLPTPTITVSETSGTTNHDGILCAGASATLDAGMYAAYAWSPAGNTQTISAAVSGTYTVTVTDGNGCQNTDTQAIVVNPNPTPTITETDNSGTPNDNILCTGGSATLDAGAYSTYTWSPSGNTQTISVNAAGTYTVVVTDVNGCTGTDDQAIAVNALPDATLSGSLLVCPSTTSAMINLNITAGVAPFTVVLSDASSHNVAALGMSILNVTVAGPGTNTFTISSITGAGGCAGSASGTATVDFGSAGEIEISGNGTPITDGDDMPDPADHTDFGLVAVGNNFTRTFTITNSHLTLPLNVSGVTITGSTDFTLMTAPASSVAANGGTTTFVVKFAPTALGLASATVVVNSSDCDEEPYNFAFQGNGVTPAAALNFDGANDFVSVPDAGNLDLGSSLTLEAWVKPESFSEYNMIIDKRDLADVSANYGLTLNYGKPMFYFWNGGNQSFHIATNAIALNAFTHLAATYDGAMVRIFVNGTQVYAQAETDVPPSNNQPLSIGRNQVSLQYFDGDIDEVRIWNTARTCDQITQLRNCELTGSEPGLVAYYNFNQGFANENNSGVTTLTDLAGGDHNGTLSGFDLTGATSNWVAPGGVTTGTSCPVTITAPEANVQGNSTNITDGDITPSTTDGTDFGLVAVNGSLARTFTIFNTENAVLTITSITSSNGLFVVSGAPTSVAVNGSETFTVTFSPTATGVQNATITINNNDCDEAVYDFVVTGKGVTPASALSFDGVNDDVIIPHASNITFNTNEDFTISLHLKIPSTNQPNTGAIDNSILEKTGVGSGYPYTIRYYNHTSGAGTNGKVYAARWNGSTAAVVTSTVALNDDNWHHVAFVKSGATLYLYVDGVLNSTAADLTSGSTTNTGPLTIGSRTSASNWFKGDVDNLRIWNVARSCEEIRQLRNCELTGSEPNLVAYYKFNQGFANEDNNTPTPVNTLTDATANGNHGTLNGFALTGSASNWVTPGGVTTGTSCPATITYPEADLLGHDNTPLADGTTSTSVAQGTNFGSVTFGSSSAAKTFTIQNNGTTALNVTSIVSSDPQFAVTALTPASPIPVGMSAEFTIIFTPTATGAQNATITINNDDCDESVYDFAVTGTGVCIPPSFSACPTGPLTANTVTGTCAAPVSYTVTEAGNPAPTVTYAFTGATTGSGTGTGSGSTFNKGNTTVTVTATSTCNPAATCSFVVTVTDIEKPQITCAGPVSINTTTGLCTGTTTLTAPNVTDNCPFGGNGLNFDGSNDQVATAAYNGTALTGDLTMECWFKGTSMNGRALIGRGFQQEFDLALWSNQLTYYHGDGSAYAEVNFNYVFTDNTWYHVAVVRNVSAQTVSLYVNGVFQQTLAYGTPLPVAQTAAFRIGNRAAGQSFLGSIDEVRVWTVARTPAQIAGNWNKELAAQSGLFALYHLNEGSANGNNAGVTTAADASGNAKDGTLTNFALSGTTSNWGIGAFGGVTNNAPATYPKGATTVIWTATDASGNTETCQQTVTVTDNEVPVLTVPAANIPLNVIATTCAADYTIASPISDNCTGSTWTYALSGATTAATSSAIASGTGSGVISFNKGVTTVTLNGVDAATNAAVQKTFTVTVADNEVPVLTAPANQSLNVIATTCAANYTIVDPIADNCTGSTWTYALSGATTAATSSAINDGTNATNVSFNKGVTTVTLNGVDAATNAAVQKTFTVTVVDNEKPTISGCTTNQSFNVIATTCAADYAIPAPTLMDNCAGPLTWNAAFSGNAINPTNLTGLASGSPSSNVSFNKGTTTVTLTATDAANNTSTVTCSFVVTVVDNEKPTITCAGPVSINTTAGQCTGTTTLTDPTMTDNCPLVLGNGLHFDGSNDLVTASGLLGASPTQFTVEFWLNPASRSDFNQEISIGSAGNGAWNGFTFHTTSTGAVYVGTDIGSRMTPSHVPDNTVVLNTWQHFAYVYSSGTGRFYKNGVLLATKANGAPPSFDVLRIAAGCCNPIHGALDELRIWNTARTQAEIQGAMKLELSGSEGNLVAYYNFNQGVANNNNAGITTLNDLATSIGGANNGTLTGFGLNGSTSNWVAGVTLNNSFTNNALATYPKGATIVTWTATDASGNTQTCEQTVTVLDNQAPTVTCPANTTVINTDAGASCQITIPDYAASLSPTDNCTAGGSILENQTPTAGSYTVGVTDGATITVTYTATDDAAMPNTRTCTVTITVNDDDAPTVACPANTTVLSPDLGTPCSITIPNYVSFLNPTDNCTSSGGIVENQTPSAGAYAISGDGATVTLTYTATDGASPANTKTCTLTITVNAAEINVKGNGVDIADGDTSPAPTDHTNFGSTTGAPITRTFTIENLGHAALSLGTGSITLTGTDAGLFSIGNITLPATVNGPSGTVTFDVTYTPVGVGTHVATVNIAANDCDESTYNFDIQGARDCSAASFTACPTSPVMVNTGSGQCNAVVNYTATANGTPAPTYTYQRSGAIADSGSGTGDGLTFPTGTTTVTVTATNPCSTPTCVFDVVVTDNEKPTFTCPTPTLTLNTTGGANCQVQIPDLVALVTNASDNCALKTSNPITQDVAAGNYNGVSDGMTIPVVVTVTDNASPANSETCVVTFTVNDDAKPTFTCPTPTLVLNTTGGANCQVVIPDLVALVTDEADNCALRTTNPVEQSIAAGNYNGVSDGMTIPVTVTVTDNASPANSTACVVTFTVNDNTKPTFTCPTPTLVLNTTGGANCQVVIPDLVALVTDEADNCALRTTNPVEQSIAAGNYNGVSDGMTIPVTVTVTDNASPANSTACVVTFTVNDNTKPTFTCPTPTLVLNTTGGANCQVVIPDLVALVMDEADNCALRTTNPVEQSIAAGNYNGVSDGMTIPVTVTVTDNASPANSTACVVTFTGNDDDAPTFTCPTPTLTLNTTGGANCQVQIPDLVSLVTNEADNCALRTTDPVEQSIAAGNYNGVSDGMTIPMTVTVTDNASPANSTACTITFTVNDNDEPTFTCPTPTLVLNTTGGSNCQVVIPDLVALVTDEADNCALRTTDPVEQSIAAGNYAGVSDGMTIPVTVTVTDNASPANSTACVVTFTVNDDDVPTVTCPANTATINVEAGNSCAITIPNYVSDLNPTDNCTASGSIVEAQSIPAGLYSTGIFNGATVTVNYTATDGASPANTSTCTVVITVNAPEADVRGNSVSILDGDVTPDAGDHTFFGNTTLGNPLTRTFSIHNTGERPLQVSSIISSNSGEFSVGALSPSGPIPAGQSASFVVTFNPSGLYLRTSTLTISTNDCNEATYNFVISGAVDCLPATITGCPNALIVNTTPGQCSAPVTFTPTITGNPTPTVAYTLSGATTGGGVGTGSGSTFNQGVTTVQFTATNDCATTACSFTVTVTDNQTPTITCPSNIVKSADAGQCSAVTNYTVTASDNCTYTLTRTNGLPSGAAFPTGTNVVNWKVTDVGGNSTICSFTITVNDGQNPSIVCPLNIVRNTDLGQCTAAVTYANPTFSDNCTGASLTRTSGLASGSAFPKGVNMVQWKATDVAGNFATCQFTVTVNDTQLPSIACPANIVKNADVGLCTAVTTFANATASDNCTSVAVVQTSGPASGTAFIKGVTTIEFKATDSASPANTKTCAFTVTVNDTQLPTITCPSNQVKNTDAGLCSAVVNYTTPTATDNCTSAMVAIQSGLISGSTFSKGVTTVVWKATDGAGLTKTCSFKVTVNDNQAPTMTCPAAISKNTDAGLCTAIVTYTNPIFTDNCPPTTGTSTRFNGLASGSAFPVGTSSVVFRAIDAAGLTRHCTMTVTVTDAQLPTITCPANIAATGSGSSCQATVTYPSPTATDNCGGATKFLLSGLASGSVFPQGVTTNTWRAQASNGQTADCSFTVTVSCSSASQQAGVSREQEIGSSVQGAGSSASKPTMTLALAPNPTDGRFNLQLQGFEKQALATIFDATGCQVWQQRIEAGQSLVTVDLSDPRFSAGLYMVTVTSDGTILTKRLVLTR